jgi:type I restriction enzyme, S subunit
MNKWETKKFKDFVTLKRGYDLPIHKSKDGNYPVIASTNIRGYHDEYKAEPPVVTVGRSGSIGQVQIIYDKAWPLNTTLYVTDSKGNNINFIYYFLQTMGLEQFNSGAGVPTLNRNHINLLKIKIPDIKTQEKIANILSTYDKLIENNNRRIEILEQTVEEIYKEWFVRMRFPGYESAEFEKGIPKEWDVKKVDEIISFDIGGGWGKDSPVGDFTKEAYVIRGTDIPSMNYGEVNYELLRFHKDSQITNRRLRSSDIIFEASGGSKDQRLGRTYYITNETLSMYDGDVICASFCKLIRIDEKHLSWYFNQYLNYAYKTETLSIFEVQSTGISNFGFTNFKKHHQVLLPTVDIMKRFFELTYNMYIEKQKLGRKNQSLKKQRDLLLPRLMNGTIEVK